MCNCCRGERQSLSFNLTSLSVLRSLKSVKIESLALPLQISLCQIFFRRRLSLMCNLTKSHHFHSCSKSPSIMLKLWPSQYSKTVIAQIENFDIVKPSLSTSRENWGCSELLYLISKLHSLQGQTQSQQDWQRSRVRQAIGGQWVCSHLSGKSLNCPAVSTASMPTLLGNMPFGFGIARPWGPVPDLSDGPLMVQMVAHKMKMCV